MEHKIDWNDVSYWGEHGRSYYMITCPICGQKNKCYAWGVAGSGKRCESCGSLIRKTFQGFVATEKK